MSRRIFKRLRCIAVLMLFLLSVNFNFATGEAPHQTPQTSGVDLATAPINTNNQNVEDIRKKQTGSIPYRIPSVKELHDKIKNAKSKEEKHRNWSDARGIVPKAKGECQEFIAVIKEMDDGSDESYRAIMENRPIDISFRRMENPELIPELIQGLNDKNEIVQACCAYALGKLKAKEAASLIRKKLQEIGDIGPSTADIYNRLKTDIAYRKKTMKYGSFVKALTEIGDEQSMEELAKRDDTWEYGNTDFAKYGSKAIPHIIKNVKKGGRKKVGAIKILDRINDPSATPQLIELLKSDDEDVKLSAIFAIGNMADPATENVLVPELKSKNRFIRSHIYTSLLKINFDKYLPNVMDALYKDHEITLDLLYALMNSKPDLRIVPEIEKFIKEDEVKNPGTNIYVTTIRSVAAQLIYKWTGKKIPYQGVEEQMKVYPNPYVP